VVAARACLRTVRLQLLGRGAGEWVPKIEKLAAEAQTTFAFANNHFQGQAITTARQLSMLLDRRETDPNIAKKSPPAGMLDGFAGMRAHTGGEEILRFAQNDIRADLLKRAGGLLLTKAFAGVEYWIG